MTGHLRLLYWLLRDSRGEVKPIAWFVLLLLFFVGLGLFLYAGVTLPNN